MRKTLWLAAVLALLLSLTACSGGGEAPSPAVPEDQHQVTDASELEGKWSSPSGNILYFVADEGVLLLPDLLRPHGTGLL